MNFIGKKVIVRCDKAGVFFGTLESLKGDIAELKNARKLWYWDGAAAIEELSFTGTKKPKNCKFTVTVESLMVIGVCQVLECTDAAIKSIEEVEEWKE